MRTDVGTAGGADPCPVTILIGSTILAAGIIPAACTPAIQRLPVPRIWTHTTTSTQ